MINLLLTCRVCLWADAATLSFDGAQHFRVTFDSASRTEAEDWRLRFRTPRPAGVLLTTAGDGNSHGRIELDLEGGRLRFTQFSTERPKVHSIKSYQKSVNSTFIFG